MKKIIIAALAVMMILAGCNNNTPAPEQPTPEQTNAVISVIGALASAPEGVINITYPESGSPSGDITITGTITEPVNSPTEGVPAGIPASSVTSGSIDIKVSIAAVPGTTPENPIASMTATITSNSSVEATITEDEGEPYVATISLTGSTTIDVLNLMGGMGEGNPTADEIKDLINKVDLGGLTLKMGDTSIDIKAIAGTVIDMMYATQDPSVTPAN